MSVNVDHSVRIGAMIWPAIVENLKRYEIIELHVQPEVHVEYVDATPGIRIIIGVQESPHNCPRRPAHTSEVCMGHPILSPPSYNNAPIFMLSHFLLQRMCNLWMPAIALSTTSGTVNAITAIADSANQLQILGGLLLLPIIMHKSVPMMIPRCWWI